MTTDADQVAQVERLLQVLAAGLVLSGGVIIAVGMWRVASERGWIGAAAQHAVGTVVDEVPFPAGSRMMFPVVRFYNERGERLDLRSVRQAPGLHPGDIADVVHVPGGDTWVRPGIFRFGCGPIGVVTGGGLVAGGVFLFRWLAAIITTPSGQ